MSDANPARDAQRNPSSAPDETLLLSLELQAQLRLRPDDARLRYEAGEQHRRGGRLQAARAEFAEAARLAPRVSAAHFQLANADYALGRFEEAVAAYERSHELDPQASTANNRGNALAQVRRIDDAIGAFEAALRLDPEFVPAYVNLGQAYTARGEFQQAMNFLMQALSRNPQHPKAQALLGDALSGLNNFESAVDCYAYAVRSNPDDVDVRTSLGVALTRLGRFKEAAEHYTLALQRRPDDPLLFNNLGEVNRARGQITESLFCFYKALELNPQLAETHSNMLLTMQYDASVSSEQLHHESLFWSQRHAAHIPRTTHTGRDRNPERKLRVGFVSADLGRHPVGRFLEPVLKHRDATGFETFCYSVGQIEDEQTAILKTAADHWITAAGLSNDALIERIRTDEIDLLIDLAGHTADHRLMVFAAKPAPVQAAWAGYSGTTGLKEIDYVIADRWTVPREEEPYFAERVVRLPNCYVCLTPPEPDVPVAPLPATASDRITFGCFNNLAKMTPAVVQLWADILRAVSGSRLFLKTKALGDPGVRENVVRMFGEQFIGADRLRLEGSAPREQLLAAYGEVDIGLDPFPFNGGLTTLEALWMGVPVVSLRGNRFVGHATESFLQNMQLGDWVAATRAEYLATAQAWAGDRARLAELRSTLRDRMRNSPLTAAEPFARSFEAALRTMWHAWCLESA
ncbi:MAG: tetratricopeptide repeat protein [Planctomycetia bacterium]|nr:tetratricopeptide repeat protein [Planctomycetia bacterium]